MSGALCERPAWSRPTDLAILEHLAARESAYPATVADSIGLRAGYVQGRCELLADRGLLEPADGEAVYRTTVRGDRAAETGVLPE